MEQGVGCPGSPCRGSAQPSRRIHQSKMGVGAPGDRQIVGAGALRVWENHGGITGMGTSQEWEHHRKRGIESLRTMGTSQEWQHQNHGGITGMETSQEKGHCRSENYGDITGMGTSEPQGHHRNGNITGLGTSWESRGTAGLGTSQGHHSNEDIKDLGAVWETGVHCEFRNIMGVSWGCHRRARPCGSGDSMGMGALWVWEHHGSIAGMGVTGLGTLQKQHRSIVSLGAPQEREQGGTGPRATSHVWLWGLPQPGQAGTAATGGL